MVNRFISVLLLAMLFSGVEGQKILSVDEAVQIALKNNFDILVAGNDADIAKANNTPGNAGMLPGIKMSGSGLYEANNIHQGLPMGAETNYPSLSSKVLSAGAQ